MPLRYAITTKFILAFLAVLLSLPLAAQQPSVDVLDTERKQAEKEIDNIASLLKTIEGRQKTGLQQLTLIKKKIDSRKHVVSTIDKQIDKLNSELKNKQEAITILQNDLEEVRRSYADLLTRYYNIRNKNNWLMYIVASENVTQAYRRMRYFREILYLLQSQADKIIAMTNQLNGEITDMARKQQALNDNLDDKQKEVQLLMNEENQSKSVLSSLKQRQAELTRQLDERKREYQKLDADLKRHLSEEAARKTPEMTGEAKLLSDNFRGNKGTLPWPVMGIVVAQFGKGHKHPVYQTVELPENNGIDIQTQQNADVYAVFSGKVSKVFSVSGYKSIIIQHGNFFTVYFKLGDVNVKVGDAVKTRQKIATVASSGEGSVLHFEIWKSNNSATPVKENPENWLIR